MPSISVTDSVAPANDLQVPFGNLTEGLTADQTVTVTNGGNADLLIGTIASSDPLAAPFSVVSDNCSNQTVPAAASCTFIVRFAPTAPGVSNDSLDVPSNDPNSPAVVVNVSGTGMPAVVNNPPDEPELHYPADGEHDVDHDVDFEWKESHDPDNDHVSYEFHLCEDDDPVANCVPEHVEKSMVMAALSGLGYGSGLFLCGITLACGIRGRKKLILQIGMLIVAAAFLVSCGAGGGGAPANNNVVHHVTGLKPKTVYKWAVVARDARGATTASVVRSFTTK